MIHTRRPATIRRLADVRFASRNGLNADIALSAYGIGRVVVRALFQMINGTIIGGFLSIVPGFAILAAVGVPLQIIFDRAHVQKCPRSYLFCCIACSRSRCPRDDVLWQTYCREGQIRN